MKTLTAILVLALLPPLSATTITVPTNQPTIQAGVDAALDGDTVLILPGTYSGEGNRDIVVLDKAIAVIGQAGAASTIIDAGGDHDGFTRISNYQRSALVIEHLSITNAHIGSDRAAGHLYLNNVVIDECSEYGVYDHSGAVVHVRDSEFKNCGTGLSIYYGAISGSKIDSCGTGIWAPGGSEILVENCAFTDNTGDALASGWFEVDSCLFIGNGSAANVTDIQISNCTITDGGDGVVGAWGAQQQDISNCEFSSLTGTAIDWTLVQGFSPSAVTACTFKHCTGNIANIRGSWTRPAEFRMVDCVIDSNEAGIVASGKDLVFEMRGCSFSHNSEGIYLRVVYPSAAIVGCDFVGNSCPTVIVTEFNMDVSQTTGSWIVGSCLFENNDGAAITGNCGRMEIWTCDFISNRGETAVALWAQDEPLGIYNCRFEDCAGDGLRLSGSVDENVSGCSFIGSQGSAIKCEYAQDMSISFCNFRVNDCGVRSIASNTAIAGCSFLCNAIGLRSGSLLSDSVTADNCHFDGNDTSVLGTATIRSSSLFNGGTAVRVEQDEETGPYVLENCRIGGMSGTAFTVDESDNQVTNCIIRDNQGAIAQGLPEASSRIAFLDCKMMNNCGGINDVADLTMTGCLYANNGGPVSPLNMWNIHGSAEFRACTFTGNAAGALRLRSFEGYAPRLSSTIVADNDGAGIAFEVVEAEYIVECCDIFSNTGGDYVGISDQTGLNGNISLDPFFCDAAAGDYGLQLNSPCAPANNKCATLIGVLPVGCAFQCGDFNGDGMTNIGDAVVLLTYVFDHGQAPLDKSGGNINCDSKINLTDIVYLIYYIFLNGPAPCEGCA